MVQKISRFLFFIILSSCSEIFIQCEHVDEVYLSPADTTWALNVQLGNHVSSWISSKGFTQSVTMTKVPSYYYSNEISPPLKLEVDNCKRYYAIPVKYGFYPSIYPVTLSFEISHNPFSKQLFLNVYQENYSTDYNDRFYEKVAVSINDSALSSISTLSRYYYYSGATTYHSNATFSQNFTAYSGKTFSQVYKVPMEAFRNTVTKSLVLRNVWIAKEVGIIQYEYGDGLIWSMK